MNRRDFVRRAAIVAAGVVAADQLELLERLAHRKVFASIDLRAGGWVLDQHGRDWLVSLTDGKNMFLPPISDDDIAVWANGLDQKRWPYEKPQIILRR